MESRDHAPDPRRWQALALVCVAMFMTVLDVSIVNVALPSIKTALNVAEKDLQWVITAYTIAFGGFLLLGGRAGDLLGRRRMFMIGIAVFSAASLACGLAGSIGVLIAARVVQGLGAAIISPATLSIITTTFAPVTVRTRKIRKGIIGDGCRDSMTMNAASNSAAAMRKPIVRPLLQPTSGAFEMP